MVVLLRFILPIRHFFQLFEVELEDELETEAEKKARHVSLYIVHTSMLVVSLGTWITNL